MKFRTAARTDGMVETRSGVSADVQVESRPLTVFVLYFFAGEADGNGRPEEANAPGEFSILSRAPVNEICQHKQDTHADRRIDSHYRDGHSRNSRSEHDVDGEIDCRLGYRQNSGFPQASEPGRNGHRDDKRDGKLEEWATEDVEDDEQGRQQYGKPGLGKDATCKFPKRVSAFIGGRDFDRINHGKKGRAR
ncbi:MAG: hypothetical protein SFU53_01480 [Terrimicrobiaceae bacterium]|nr:hypothetical protein [Terrimicrobiaceae bacterium]